MFLANDVKLMPYHPGRSDLPIALVQTELCSGHLIGICSRFMYFAADVHFLNGSVQRLTGSLFQFVVGYGLSNEK